MTRRPRIYIAGPISRGDLLTNVNQATEAFVALARAGLAPLCPHWSVYAKPARRESHGDGAGNIVHQVVCEATAAGNDRMTHADWLGVDLPWVEVSDAVLRLPGESAGADQETAHARERGIPVFESVAEAVAWAESRRFFAAAVEPVVLAMHGGRGCPGKGLCDLCHPVPVEYGGEC